MKLLVSTQSGVPIYEQIETQLREQIIRGDIPPHSPLPSIRALAKDLQVGIITVKRAYDDLILCGYAYSLPGKGVYASELGAEQVEEFHDKYLNDLLKQVVDYAKRNGISQEKVVLLAKNIWKE
jgi:GntR family transcriptional regulator